MIRVDPRMLSTAQTVSSCGPGFGLKEPVEALAFLVSDKEGRAIVGRQWALRAAKGGALQDTSSTRPGKLSPLETGLNPTALGGQRRLIPACSHPTQPASGFKAGEDGETNGPLVSPTPGTQSGGPNERPLFSQEGNSQGQPPGSSVCPRTDSALLGCHVPRVAAASST